MTEDRIPTRKEIGIEKTWNAPSVFPSEEAWAEACVHLEKKLEAFSDYKGHLVDGPETLSAAFEAFEDLIHRLGKIYVYANMSHSVDTTDQAASGRHSQALTLYGKARAATGFFDPELLAVGRETLDVWIRDHPRLAVLEHHVENLFRKHAHIRSTEVEELLGMLTDPFASVAGTTRMLTSADFQFEPAIDSKGRHRAVTQGSINKILVTEDRQARKTAWENYTGKYLEFKNTLANNLATSIKQNVVMMRARNHASTLEAALFEHNIQVEVFHNLITTFRNHLPTWHRYWAIRRKALGVEILHPYDIWAPLTEMRPDVSYEQAVDWICEGLAPMGEDYLTILRRGCYEDRWVDSIANIGKRAGAFSSGAPGTHPFIMMSYADTVFSLSTLAHELGHSMHSYLTWQSQPVIYSDYSLFVAEVASNFHQAMVRAHLLESNPDPTFQISVIEEAMANFYRYFLVMPTLARFELETHQRVERGEGLTADFLIGHMAELFCEAYGDGMHVDEQLVGITWAIFGHLYVDYYVYAYATGLAGAHALANRVRKEGAPAVEDYLNFLRAGASDYPLDALKRAGVDLSSPRPIEETFEVLAGMVDRLESLLS